MRSRLGSEGRLTRSHLCWFLRQTNVDVVQVKWGVIDMRPDQRAISDPAISASAPVLTRGKKTKQK